VAAVFFIGVVVAFVARALVAAGLFEAVDFRAAPFAGTLVAAAPPDVADFFDGAGFGLFDAAIRASFPAC